MADHDELVAEMLVLEQMGTQERQKLAKKRRLQQLKKWSHREKEWIAKEKQLNKRLANILNEENNGLNLKQYTTYNSNQQTKKGLTTNTANNNHIYDNRVNDERNTNNGGLIMDKKSNGGSLNNNNNSLVLIQDGPYAKNLAPNGRVHFNVSVMLLEAAARNDYDEVKRLLSLGVSPDSVNHDGLTALHQCCIDASEPIMNLLLEYGASVDARDTERWTPLHAACTCGHLNLVKILVEHGADLLAVNGDGNMPFDICEDEATLDYIESQMIKRGVTQEMIDLTRASSEIQMLAELEELTAANSGSNVQDANYLNFADENGVSQLHIAATNNYISVVKFLLKHGINVNVCDTDRWTPLHGVACWGNEQHIKVAEMLVEAGADLTAKTSNDETVFDLCDNTDLLERLNQLKDELESKQVTGSDRLRRTQSRTNSRVHSVRRTRVQDKNQISRRDAREEAMLRVESSGENTGVVVANTDGEKDSPTREQCSSSSAELRNTSNHNSSNGTPVLGRPLSSTALINSSSRGTSSLMETNLDRTSFTKDDSLVSKSSSNRATDRVDSMSEQNTTRSQPLSVVSVKPPDHLSIGDNQEHGTTTVRVNSSSGSHHSRDQSSFLLGKASPGSNRQTIDSNERQSQRSSKGTTVVQVHLAPINYTLSNLKKHRSDLRLRGVNSIGSPIQLSPEPVSQDCPDRLGESVFETRETNVNGWSASINKFRGQPSEIIEERRRCCIII